MFRITRATCCPLTFILHSELHSHLSWHSVENFTLHQKAHLKIWRNGTAPAERIPDELLTLAGQTLQHNTTRESLRAKLEITKGKVCTVGICNFRKKASEWVLESMWGLLQFII